MLMVNFGTGWFAGVSSTVLFVLFGAGCVCCIVGLFWSLGGVFERWSSVVWCVGAFNVLLEMI